MKLARLAAICTLLILLISPYLGGLYYGLTGDHSSEQQCLDKAVAHLKLMHTRCNDADLQGILDYTIRRYNKIGAWDVMVMPLIDAVGCNCPWTPGITLDTSVLLFSAEETALILVHEALHDYAPYLGHRHINTREQKLYKLSRP